MRGEAPNDRKLSDGGGRAQPVPAAGKAEGSEAQAVTDRSRSLERMVRRLCVADLHTILTKFIEMGEGDSPVFVEIDDMEVPIRETLI